LGITYRDRLRGDRAQNLEDAIQAFRHALEVHTQDEYAVDWASIQNSLGLAYRDRLRGERAQNLEDGICSLRNALQVRKREHYASDWAMTQNNLGLLYWDRLRGDRAQNIEDAIQAFEQALEVHTRDEYTNQWVLIQTNLGGVYRDRLRGDRAQNIEDAIAIILHTLEVSKREDHPELWAIMQNNLGGAYHDRLRGDRAQNLEDAISALQQALEVYTQEEYAERWATTQTNLGVIYRDRLRGERTENIEKAVALFQQALQILTSEQFSRAHRDTAYYLGIVLYEEQRWAEARAAHESAHEALTLLRGETLREESRRQLAKENDLLYATLIHCCLQMNDTHAAATYALSGKSRSLTEVLAGDSQSLDEVLSQDIKLAKEWEPVQDLKFELNTLLASKNLIKHSSRIAELRQEINYHIDTLLFRFPALVAVQPLPSLSIEQTQTLSQLLGNTPLIEYIRHKGGWGAFIITPDNVVYVPLAENLDELLEADMTSILNDSFWIQNKKLLDRSKELAQMYTLVIEPLQPYISATGSLVLAPTQLLHLIPFQALLSPKGLYLSENYSLGFVPSLTTLHVLYEQRQQHKLSEKIVQTEQLLSVAYSGEGRNYLPSVREEAEAVSSYFTKPVQLLEDEALPENLFNAVASHAFEVIHVGCHGKFNIKNPLDSALELAQGQLLTVNDIRIRLRLRGYPLVVLSACQTGQTRPEQGDETNGLSWAFLAAGASAVVSSQWSVPDQATHELFKVFYLVRQQTHIGDVEALQQAINQLQKDEKYYRKPFYWGAFQIMGLPFTL
jgi:CHAT domain-containing protein